MKTIGLIGGMSWESSAAYYRIINEAVRDRLGGLHSAKLVMCSVDFAEVETFRHKGRWDKVTHLLVDAAGRVENGGADFLLLCTNTMHKLADDVQEQIGIPLLHIADATAEAVTAQGLKRIGLLGTRMTMQEGFYRGRLVEKHGLDVIVPNEEERSLVHRVIYDELCVGERRDASSAEFMCIIQGLVEDGAEGIILGCTEIGLLVTQDDSRVPLFDTTRIHATAAVERALSG